jgi:hypothetical protein
MENKKYTKSEVLALMEEKNFRKQFGKFRKDTDGVMLGTVRTESMKELVALFGSKLCSPEATPKDAFAVDGVFCLEPKHIEAFPDPLGLLIMTSARQALRQLFKVGGTSDYARFADCTKLQVYPPDENDALKVKVCLQFHIWYASTRNGLEPVRSN